MTDSELIRRLDRIENKVRDIKSNCCAGGTAMMVFVMWLAFIMNGCSFTG